MPSHRLVVHLDLGPVSSEVCPCGTSLLAADVLHVTPAGVSRFGRIGVESVSGRRHECPEWRLR